MCELRPGILFVAEWFITVYVVCGGYCVECVECDVVYCVCGGSVFVSCRIFELCVVRRGYVFEQDVGNELYVVCDGLVFGRQCWFCVVYIVSCGYVFESVGW